MNADSETDTTVMINKLDLLDQIELATKPLLFLHYKVRWAWSHGA